MGLIQNLAMGACAISGVLKLQEKIARMSIAPGARGELAAA